MVLDKIASRLPIAPRRGSEPSLSTLSDQGLASHTRGKQVVPAESFKTVHAAPKANIRYVLSSTYMKIACSGMCGSDEIHSWYRRPPWNPLGTLWKDFSSIFPYSRLRTQSNQAGELFYMNMSFRFNWLIKSLFKNLSVGPAGLWKPDCDYFSDCVRAGMVTLWR